MGKVLLFVENGFEDRELMYPYYRFQEAGYKVDVVGPGAKVTYNGEYGLTLKSDFSPQDVNIEDYAAIIIPGGRAPDRMRTNKGLVNLAKEAFQKGKVMAAICHGPQLLIEAGLVKGKRATCYVSVSTDLKNAGGIYLNKSVVVDGNLVTSRFPADLPDFCRETLRLLEKRNV
ncbi:MAG: type 1 glutamine amidotransferase [Candidatus Bathyarchaeota archaeon]|nr:type 1 glutamine amidotransferase [Candidatus Bathyarchaeota archaeon]MDH5623073.1 type 1 glutamine amidotransferase [Candidatus Bathyarchaeota archaeon]MDH5635165.1 type 1 glutamine amidotransferase [Candidatus Bathyarchaeota archaeon]MDH5701331.1 type 1 glutamine amidotransferase [Candidatus Bathyarchaeota archaeon]